MSRRLSLTILSAIFVLVAFAPSALAASCDANACIAKCQKSNPQFGAGQGCTTNCLQAMDKLKKAGKCK
jgi:hypothetical protein